MRRGRHRDNLPVRDDDAYDYLFAAPAKMQAAGVKFAISTGNDGAEVRDLPYHAGLAGAEAHHHEIGFSLQEHGAHLMGLIGMVVALAGVVIDGARRPRRKEL